MNRTFRALLISGVVLAGCAQQPAAPTSSTLRGHIDQATFAASVKSVTVLSSAGRSATAPIDPTGHFSISLAKGASYRFFFAADGKGTPLVLRSSLGHLQTSVTVSSGGAIVDMGAVRFWGGNKARLRAFAVTMPGSSGTATLTCSNSGDGDHEHDGDNHDGDQSDGQNNDTGADCVDGLDAATQAPCDGGPRANQGGSDGETSDGGDEADPSQAMGIADLQVPADIGCSGDGETSDSEEED